MLIPQMRDTVVSLPESHWDFVWDVQGGSWFDGIAGLVLLLALGLVVRRWFRRRRRVGVGVVSRVTTGFASGSYQKRGHRSHERMITHSTLHHHIIRSFVERGYPPTIAELADSLEAPVPEIHSALLALQQYHGVVLHTGSHEIWIAHPFSAAPTNFWVRTRSVGCWANCAWCAMGAVTLLGGTADVTTTIGAESKQVQLRVANGAIDGPDLFVHFPIPMSRAWDNVVYTCSMMLLFESEAQIDAWCERHRVRRGDIQPLSRVLAFAQDWYGRHLDRDWQKWSAAEAVRLFQQHGLTHPIWRIAAEPGRF